MYVYVCVQVYLIDDISYAKHGAYFPVGNYGSYEALSSGGVNPTVPTKKSRLKRLR